MIIRNVELETVCGVTSKIPDNTLPEVAFAGKSNVGKSSLINALMNRKALARTSSKPGKTQTINFYNINRAMYLVDLPGYGYANANVEIKAQWGRMIENYLHSSKRLTAVFLLIDIRHEPSENDRLMYEWMVAQGFSPILIATKADKLNRSQLQRHTRAIEEGLSAAPGTVLIPFSSVTKQGRDEIWSRIDALVGWEEPVHAADATSKSDMPAEADRSGAAKKRPSPEASHEAAPKKERWKKTDRPVAKKTARNRARKKHNKRS